MYTAFATFLILFLLSKLNIHKKKFYEWGWIFIVISIMDATLSYLYLMKPYYHLSNDSLAWRWANIDEARKIEHGWACIG